MTRRFLPLAGLLVVVGVTAARAQTVVIGVGGQLSAPQYEYFQVPIYADMSGAGGAKLGSYTIRISWAPSVLSYYGYEGGALGEPVVRSDSSSYGVLYVGGISASGGSGVFDLVRLTMSVRRDSTSAVNLEVRELSAAGTFADLRSSVTVRNGTACLALGWWGDLDRDGLANSRDALAILSAVVGLATPGFDQQLGDVDGDGLTNSRDALILLSYAVGIAIPGQRVLLVAPGSCVVPQVPAVTILPDTSDLVIGQSVQLRAVLKDASGALTAVTGVHWDSDDPTIAFVDQDGILTARDTGRTLVRAALGPGVTVTAPVIGRARRSVWLVDAKVASGALVQLGNQRYPLATPERAFDHLREGDTIRVAPGIHDYTGDYYYEPEVSFFLLGDTLADGTRPTLRGPGGYWTALPLAGGQRVAVRNLIFQGFDELADLYGVRNFELENVRFEGSRAYYNYGIVADALDTLRVLRSEFVGDLASYPQYGILIDYSASTTKAVIIHDSRFTDWLQAVYVYNADSLDVRRSEFRNASTVAVRSQHYPYYYYYNTWIRPTVKAFAVGNTLDSVYRGLELDADTAVVSGNVMTRVSSYGAIVNDVERAPRGAVVSGNRITCTGTGSPQGVVLYMPASVDDNAVRDCYYGVYAYQSTSYPLAALTLRRDSVIVASGASGYGVYVSGRYGLVTLNGNTVRSGTYGVEFTLYLAAGDTARVVMDSNAVSLTQTAGIYLYASGPTNVVGTRNNIGNNQTHGVYQAGYNGGVWSFTQGRFVGNRGYAVYSGYGIDATQNWWGSTFGAGGSYGSGRTDADSVYYNVNVSNWLTSDPTNVPPLGEAFGGLPVAAPQPLPLAGVKPENDVARRAAERAAAEKERQRVVEDRAARRAERQRPKQ